MDTVEEFKLIPVMGMLVADSGFGVGVTGFDCVGFDVLFCDECVQNLRGDVPEIGATVTSDFSTELLLRFHPDASDFVIPGSALRVFFFILAGFPEKYVNV
jgi:hypothetical protein